MASIRDAAIESGAVVEGYLPEDPTDFEMDKCCVDEPPCPTQIPVEDRALYPVWPLTTILKCGEYVLERCRQIGVSVVLYDAWVPLGIVVARRLGIPYASLVTYPGMGSLRDMLSLMEAEGRLEVFADIRKPYGKAIKDKFGIDLSCHLLTRRQYYSETNFVTTCEDLVAELPKPGEQKWADELRAHFSFTAVGCLVSASAPHVSTVSATPTHSVSASAKSFGNALPTAELMDHLARGRKIIYAALGTMALLDRWNIDLGRLSGNNLPLGTTGKAFCQHVWKALFAALEELGEEYFCVLPAGKQPDALDFLGSSEEEISEHLPCNVFVCESVPQVEMLNRYTSVFVSHVGFNSLQESLMAGVPLVAIPQAVDQPGNARKVQDRGWGQAFFKPMETCTAAQLADVLRQVSGGASYRRAVQRARAELAGGAPRLAEHLVVMAKDQKGQNGAVLGGC